ncbi:hypothetical protein EAG_09901 [Camponotus floridanus]|uniref:Uncharacterized protein n=1 Tax=Camponotus floridanus TaxID=104421 RepID=E2A6C6_CAMFO|nr:hypothetical protein EAG_09901 [Camponotus floridanus]
MAFLLPDAHSYNKSAQCPWAAMMTFKLLQPKVRGEPGLVTKKGQRNVWTSRKAKAKKGGKSCGGNQSDSLGSMDDHEAVADQMPQGTMLKELGMHALYNTYRSHNQMDRRFYTVSIFIIYMT